MKWVNVNERFKTCGNPFDISLTHEEGEQNNVLVTLYFATKKDCFLSQQLVAFSTFLH